MNKNKGKGFFRALAACTVAAALVASVGCGKSDAAKGRGGRPIEKIAVITKQQLSFWDDVKKGAEDAGAELGYNIMYTVAEGDNDYVSQIDAIKNAMSAGAKAIVIAPNSDTDLNSVFKEAESRGIKIVNINSKADYEGVATLINSSDSDSGALAARSAVKILRVTDPNLENVGKIAIIGHTASTAESRIEGFIQVFTEQFASTLNPEVTLTVDEAMEGLSLEDKRKAAIDEQIGKFKKGIVQGESCAKRTDAEAEAKELLKSDGNCISVIFATNTNTTLGVCDAVNDLNLGDKIIVVGFNSDQEELDYIKTGILDGTVIQNPYVMGYLGVRYAHKLVQGSDVTSHLDIGSTFVNQSNMSDDFIKLLLNKSDNNGGK